MANDIATALISSGGSVLVAVTAPVLSYRGFASLDAGIPAPDSVPKNGSGRVSTRQPKCLRHR
jgi:hypothetical protein